MAIRKYFCYILYRFARSAPTSNLRLLFLKKIPYVEVGENCYLGPDMTLTPFDGGGLNLDNFSGNILLSIGDRVAISPNVSFLCSMHAEKSKLSHIYGKFDKIIVENDVWVGAGAIILAGVKVHKCSVIGAGAVVTKDVRPYSVVVGSPAKLIKKLNYDDDIT